MPLFNESEVQFIYVIMHF